MEWPIAAGGNGHYYEFVLDHTDWFDARNTAAASTFLGLNGRLVTITSSAENAWVWDHMYIGINDFRHRGNWIGAYQAGASMDYTDEEQGFAPHERWAWVTGEAWTYTNWVAGDPNDGKGPGDSYFETPTDYAKFSPSSLSPGKWHEVSPYKDPSIANGYMIEYEVPEPSSLGLLLLGGLALLRRRR